jgi:hypothetical protein
MAQPDEDFFQYSARWHELRRLATGDPNNEMFTNELIAILEERDKELEYFLENRVTTADVVSGTTGGRLTYLYVAGRWYEPSLNANANGTSAIAANEVHYIPVSWPHAVTITDVAVDITATTGGNIRLGIYNNVTSGIWLPGTLHTEFGTKAVSSTGGNEINSLSVALSANTQYWLAYQSDTARTVAVMGTDTSPSGGFASSGTNTPTRAITTPDTYASGFPDPAGTPVSEAVDGTISIRFKFTA